MMSSIGIPEDRMVFAIINPKTNAPISGDTLRKYFRGELNQGLLEADLKAGMNLLKQTETSAAAAIFWAKCRLRWRERFTVEIPAGPAPTEQQPGAEQKADQAGKYEIARRVAFLLAMGAEMAPPDKDETPAKPQT